MILHLTTDLMATSGLRAEARKNEVVVKMVSKPMELQSLLENHEVSLLVIDLQTRHLTSGYYLLALKRSVSSANQKPWIKMQN